MKPCIKKNILHKQAYNNFYLFVHYGMKIIFLLLALTICTVKLFAQEDDADEKKLKIGIGAIIALPLSNLKQYSNFGAGASALAVYHINETIAGFAQVEVVGFKNKGSNNRQGTFHIPIIVGARYRNGNFFLALGAGYGYFSIEGEKTGGFLTSPQIGYDFGKLQAIINYTSTAITDGNLSYVGLKVFRTF